MSSTPVTSFSQVRRFEECPKSFEFHYRHRLPVVPSEPLVFGKVMHAACERIVRESMKNETAVPQEQAVAIFEQAWSESGLTGLPLFDEGTRMATQFARQQEGVDPKAVLALEHRFAVPVGQFSVVGVMDRVDRLDDETIEIIDYKTNHQLYTRDELNGDLQLPLYAAAARQLWPWAKKVRLTFWMLRHGIRVPVKRTAEEIDRAVAYVHMLADKAANACEFEAKLGAHCAYCDHRDACDAYAAALQGQRRFACNDTADLDAVAREREEVTGLARILEGRKRELEVLLKSALKEKDELHAAGMRYRMIPTRSPAEYPLGATLEAVASATGLARDNLVDRLTVIDRDALSGMLDELEESLTRTDLRALRAELELRAVRSVTPRFTASPVPPERAV